MKKRIAAILLSFCMILTLLSTAFAADTEDTAAVVASQTELKEALLDTDITKITLKNDIPFTEIWEPVEIAAERTLTIDGAGFEISGMEVTGYLLESTPGAIGSGHSADYYCGFIGNNHGTLTINNLDFTDATVDMKTSENSEGSSILAVVCANNTGTLVYNNVNVDNSTVKGYTKAGILHGFTQGSGTFTANQCSIINSDLVVEADGYAKFAAFNGLVIGYDGGNKAKTNGIRLENNTYTVDTSSTEYTDDDGAKLEVKTSEDGLVYVQIGETIYGICSPTYSHNSYGDSVTPFVAKVGDYAYETLDGAIAAASDEDTIVLKDDVAFTGTISLNSGRIVNIDLNGHNIAFTPSEGMSQSGFLVGKSTLNLTGKGMLYETAPNYSPIMVYGATEDVADYSIVNVGKDVTLKGWAPIFINGNAVEDQPRAAYGIKITVEGTLESVQDTSGAAGHGVYINGTNSRTEGNVPVITLTETSNVTSFGNGIYAAGYANWNLAGNITGEDSLSIKSGTFNITGGTYTATGEFADPAEANGNGSENTGSAVSITSNKAYAPKVELTITGGNFISQNGYAFYEGIAQKDGVPAADASYATLAVSGGTFTGNSGKGAVSINEAEKKDVITGGTFSSDVSTYVPGTHDEAMVSATTYTVGQYNDGNVEAESGAQTDMAARRTLASGTTVYYATLAEAVANYTDGDVALTLLKDNTEAIEISTPMTISKNGYTAQGLTAAAGISMVESADSYTFYTMPATQPETTYSIQYQLEKLDGSGYDNDGEPVANVAADAVETTIQEAVKAYTGYSLGSIELENTTFTVKLNRNIYTVIFESDDTVFSQQSLKFGETITAPAEEPVKNRYTFRGWKGYTDGMTVESDVTFSADWKRNSSGGATITKPTTMYAISIESGENGKVSADKVRVAGGSEVVLTVTPDEGYVLDNLTVTSSNGSEISLTDAGDGEYTFTMPDSAVTVAATFREDTGENPENPEDGMPFADVAEEDWFYDAVSYVYEQGLMNGTSDTAFEPDLTTTRGMIVTILYRLEESPAVTGTSSFADVAAGQYYADAVAWAAANDIVTGYDVYTFGPDDTITREQMAAILYRYADYKGYDVTATADLSAYTDADDISTWAQTAMGWANAEELITGVTTTTLEPAGSATRAQVAAILMRFCETVVQ